MGKHRIDTPRAIGKHHRQHRARGYRLSPCVQCGKPFAGRPNRKHCSSDCRAEANRWAIWQKNTRGKVLECPVCGVTHCPLKGETNTHYGAQSLCSNECRRIAGRQHARRPELRKRQKQRRQQRIRAGFVEHVDPITVFQRDKWSCQDCGIDTPRELVGSVYDDDAPTVDHKIALCNGGEHSYDNVQLLCRRCNYMKSRRDYAQHPLAPVES